MKEYQIVLQVSVLLAPVIGLALLFYWHTGANNKELSKRSIGLTGLVSILVSALLVLSADTAKMLSPFPCYAFIFLTYTLASGVVGGLTGCLVNGYLRR
ncbi:hypothetical protein SG34_020205 [Thalassomonas viridans]|uniref:Uncharacterized protein n=1 Tax=Thalassomonas viridans TaxID=137584 RepID=A0AAE9YYR9_9GAMM|nr:hypothetical protein [Thalassomonas viridans]WDE03686.1 hypothetical protein SG34_020205 [Thalassomonas viridans]